MRSFIKVISLIVASGLMLSALGCSKRNSDSRLIVEIPAGFTGDFVIEMGVRNAAPLAREGDSYVVTVSTSGKTETSTVIEKPEVTFRNKSDGKIWGYSHSQFTTGDGISIGGKIEFFVGTQKEYDANQIKENHSRDFRLEGSQA